MSFGILAVFTSVFLFANGASLFGHASDDHGNVVPVKCTVNCDANGLPSQIPVPSGHSALSTGVNTMSGLGSSSQSVIRTQASRARVAALARHGNVVPVKCTVNCDANGLPVQIPVPAGHSAMSTGVNIMSGLGSASQSAIRTQASRARVSALAHHGNVVPVKCTVNCDANGLPSQVPVPAGHSALSTGVNTMSRLGSTSQSVINTQTSKARVSALAHQGFWSQPLHVAQPTYGYSQPTYGYAQPTYGYAQSTYGYAQPTYGYAQPTYGYAQPTYGYAQPTYGYATGSVDVNTDGFGYTGLGDDMYNRASGDWGQGATDVSHWLGHYSGAALHYPDAGHVQPGYFGNFGDYQTGYAQSGYGADNGDWLANAGRQLLGGDNPCAALSGRGAVLSQSVMTILYRMCPPEMINVAHTSRAVFDKAQSSLDAEAKPVA